jgi:hypothetical protein
VFEVVSLYGLLFCVLFNSTCFTGSILLFIVIDEGVVISGGFLGDGVVVVSIDGVVVLLEGVVDEGLGVI